MLLIAPLSAAQNIEPPIRAEATQQLHALFDRYLAERFALDPYLATTKRDMRHNQRFANTWSDDWRAQSRALNERYVGAVGAVPAQALSRRDRVDREVFLYSRRKRIQYLRFPMHLLPISPVSSRLNNFARMGAGDYHFPFDTVGDYDDWLARVSAAQPWFEQLLRNFRRGMKTGVVHSHIVAERLLPQIEAHIVDAAEDSLYYRPVLNMPAHFSAADRQRLDQAYRRMIREDLIPAYQRSADFLRREYIPAARASTGWRDLPDGAAWYRALIRYYTSTDLRPDEIHRMGLEQMALLDAELDRLRLQVGFAGSNSDWLHRMLQRPDQYYDSADQLLTAYRSLVDRASQASTRLFNRQPVTPLVVHPVESFRAASAARASYRRPPADLSGPGIVYVNTADLRSQPKFDIASLFLHEAIPGHHFQLALMMEMQDLPLVRRSETETVFTEGWALYAQYLGLEMGFYQDPAQHLGYLNSMRLRAARLVVDTGLHALGWNRERALGYMTEHTTRSAPSIRNEVDRYIARPGQALAYMTGYLKILQLRRAAETALGDGFDLPAFHQAILADGALPLTVLDGQMRAWIQRQTFAIRQREKASPDTIVAQAKRSVD